MSDQRFSQLMRCGMVAVFAVPLWIVAARMGNGIVSIDVGAALIGTLMSPLMLAANYLWAKGKEDQ